MDTKIKLNISAWTDPRDLPGKGGRSLYTRSSDAQNRQTCLSCWCSAVNPDKMLCTRQNQFSLSLSRLLREGLFRKSSAQSNVCFSNNQLKASLLGGSGLCSIWTGDFLNSHFTLALISPNKVLNTRQNQFSLSRLPLEGLLRKISAQSNVCFSNNQLKASLLAGQRTV